MPIYVKNKSMKSVTISALFLLVIAFVNTKVAIAPVCTTEGDYNIMLARANYLSGLVDTYKPKPMTTYVLSEMWHAPPPSGVCGIDVEFSCIDPSGASITPPNFKSELRETNSKLYFSASFTPDQLDACGCQEMPAESAYVGRQCRFRLDYYSTDQNIIVRTTEYRLAVTIRKETSSFVSTDAAKIYKSECDDCIITSTVPTNFDLFSDEACTKQIPAGGKFIYGGTICAKLSTTHFIGSRYFLKPTYLHMMYKDSTGSNRDLDIMPGAKICGGTACPKAMNTASFKMVVVGTNLAIWETVRFQSSLRLLQSNLDGYGTKAQSAEYEVVCENGNSPPCTTSSAYSLAASMVVMLLMVLVLV